MTSEDAIVQFQNINVNRLDEAAGVFIGNNRANYWRSMTKKQHRFRQRQRVGHNENPLYRCR